MPIKLGLVYLYTAGLDPLVVAAGYSCDRYLYGKDGTASVEGTANKKGDII